MGDDHTEKGRDRDGRYRMRGVPQTLGLDWTAICVAPTDVQGERQSGRECERRGDGGTGEHPARCEERVLDRYRYRGVTVGVEGVEEPKPAGEPADSGGDDAPRLVDRTDPLYPSRRRRCACLDRHSHPLEVRKQPSVLTRLSAAFNESARWRDSTFSPLGPSHSDGKGAK
jgi:hypothetical protein